MDYDFISPADLGKHKYIYSSIKKISTKGIKVSRSIPPNTILCVCIGSSIDKVGLSYHEVSCTNQQINSIICNIFFDFNFIYYVLLYYSDYWKNIATFSTVPILNKGRFEEIEIPVCTDIKEQRKIGKILSLVQDAIAQQEQLIALTTELKKSLTKKLFTEGTRGEPQKMTEIGLIPESWDVVEFENLAVLQRGKDLTKANFKNGTIPVAGSSGIIGYHDTSNVKGSGITVGRSGSVGAVRYYDFDFWAHNTTLFVKDFKGNNQRFTAYYLEILNLARFKTGASVPTLDRNSFSKLAIGVPKIEEQDRIAEILLLIDTKIEFLKNKLFLYKDMFNILLHQLMTAQIRVDDLDLCALDLEIGEGGE
jgi:type I restriction enzyme S subunit